ncbi:hypothetical protein BGX38DRAFT_1274916 [Terfezia claveryi]|nr:hypothetical protein BGX38DRAFT_1274916 [Terfezia claveryi]
MSSKESGGLPKLNRPPGNKENRVRVPRERPFDPEVEFGGGIRIHGTSTNPKTVYNRSGRTSLRGLPLALPRLKNSLRQEKSRAQRGGITTQEAADVDTDNIEYLAYNTTDDEDNNSLDLSSVPASTTDGDNSDDVETDNESTDNGEDHTQASRLYRQTLDEIFANPDSREVDKVLEDSNDDEEDEDYAEITSNQIQKAKKIHQQKVNVTGVVTGVVMRVVKGVIMGVMMRVVKGVVTGVYFILFSIITSFE